MSMIEQIIKGIEDPFSTGSSSTIYKALWQDQIVALKIIQDDKNGICKEVLSEISILNELKHPNIIKLYDVVLEKRKSILILELADRDLSYDIQQKNYNVLFMFQLCRAVAYCHEHHIIHGDIKPQNILIKNEQIKLADFGLSQKIIINTLKTFNIVSLWYRAPELLKKQGYSYSIDVWSIGCVWSEYLTGQVLFKGNMHNQLQLYNDIPSLRLCENLWLADLLMIDPSKRIRLTKLFL